MFNNERDRTVNQRQYDMMIDVLNRMDESEDIPPSIHNYIMTVSNRLRLYGATLSAKEMQRVLKHGIDVYFNTYPTSEYKQIQ